MIGRLVRPIRRHEAAHPREPVRAVRVRLVVARSARRSLDPQPVGAERFRRTFEPGVRARGRARVAVHVWVCGRQVGRDLPGRGERPAQVPVL